VRAEVEIYEVNLGWNIIEIILVNLAETVNVTIPTELSKIHKELLVGLPEDTINPCSLALAYLYTIEDMEMGTRIKNKAILFLANLLGLSQARDVIEAIKKCKGIALIGVLGEPRKTIPDIIEKLDIKDYNMKFKEAKCTIEDLEKVTLLRINKL